MGVIILDLAVQAVHVTNQSMIFAIRPEAHSRLVAGYMLFYSIGSAIGAIASTAMYDPVYRPALRGNTSSTSNTNEP
jgi:hypothetical protein